MIAMGEGALSLTTLLAIGALALLPLLLIAATSFAKLAVVLTLLRNALGASEIPSAAIITALAAILSVYVMAPVATQMAQRGAPAGARVDMRDPLSSAGSRGALLEAVSAAAEPLAAFLDRNAGPAEKKLFLDLARRARSGDSGSIAAGDIFVVLPAFLITELKEAFQIGVLVLLPFVIVDLVVGSILVAVGMSTLSPAVIALPFKLLLFVLVNGWYVLSEALVAGYR
jgi:type III secretion protein R